jgi:SH3-like domain-containing protein
MIMLQLSVSTPSQSIASSDNCNFLARVWDEDPNGTNIRDNPKGAVIDKIYPDTAETGYTIEVIGSSNNWIKCRYVDIKNRDKTGWIYGGMVKLGTRNYGDNQTFNLYSSHDKKSEITRRIAGEKEVQVFGCHENWAYIKVMVDGKAYFGWLEPEMQCASAVTNCC